MKTELENDIKNKAVRKCSFMINFQEKKERLNLLVLLEITQRKKNWKENY